MISILAESWYASKVSAIKFKRDIFVKTKILPLRPNNSTTNNQSLSASIQVSSASKSKEINKI